MIKIIINIQGNNYFNHPGLHACTELSRSMTDKTIK